jgi:hypothetical protein
MKKNKPLDVAKELFQEKYSDADCFLLCGSVVRGEDTPFSDLDIVIIYESLANGRRESFIYNNWHVEIFVHDLETLNYFFEKMDRPTNCPSLPQMVREGILISNESHISIRAKELANAFFSKGPVLLDHSSLNRMRYTITDLVDDIRQARNNSELIASGSKLLEVLSEFIFRANKCWSGTDKWIPRRLIEIDSKLEKEFFSAFDHLFENKDSSAVIDLCEKILLPHGGFLFEGHNLDAPAEWKLPIND